MKLRPWKFRLGVILGEPTGISSKHWLSGSTAIDAGLAWSLGDSDDVYLHMDYLIQNFDWIQSSDPFASRLSVYYGIGGRAILQSDTRVGARGVMGLAYFTKGVPIDIFLELAPVFDFTPATDLSISFGLGARYFFSAKTTK